jgi:hypothetical protein
MATEIISNKGADGEPLTDVNGDPIQGAEIIAVSHGGKYASADSVVAITTTDSNGEYAFTDEDLPYTYDEGNTAQTDYLDIYARIGTSSNIRQAVPIRPWQGYQLENPATLPTSNLHARFEAKDLNLNDGDVLSSWADTSGNGNDLDTVYGDLTYRQNITPSGNAAVEFDGLDASLEQTSFGLNHPFSVFTVIQVKPDSQQTIFYSRASATDADSRWNVNQPGDWDVQNELVGGDNDETFKIFGAVHDSSGGALLRLDSTTLDSGSVTNQDLDAVSVGDSSKGWYLDGYIAAIVFYDDAKTESQAQEVEDYFETVYGPIR